jgi:hypothetical protein
LALPLSGPGWPRTVDPAEPRFVGKHRPKTTARRSGPPSFPDGIKKPFFKSIPRLDISDRDGTARHQLALTMPRHKAINRALPVRWPFVFS